MKKKSIISLIVLVALGSTFFIQHACKKAGEVVPQPEYLSVSLARLTLMHDLYYRLKHHERSIEIDFSEMLEENSVEGNIILRDKNGSLESDYDLQVSGRKVMLMLHSGFQLKDGWKYLLDITTGIKSTSGLSLEYDKTFQLRTLAWHPHENILKGELALENVQRNAIACISDIHMGDDRAETKNYCWFGKNADALENFLEFVDTSKQFRQLVILGDLFDEWLIPWSISPFDSSININNSEEFFKAVANSTTNLPIFTKLKEIALNPEVELVYVHGNHDMLTTQDMLNEIIPNVTWAGEVSGLGKYSPTEDIIMEHGHRYDFFNCPQPLVNSGHMLPPGYFISRLYAQGLMDKTTLTQKGLPVYDGSFEFLAAWEVAILYTLLHFEMWPPHMDEKIILMGGIDGYHDPFSFHGARDMYADNIEDYWNATQTLNEVPVHIDCCLQAIWNGHSDLFSAARDEYIKQPPSPKAYKIVAFGHTHHSMIKVYPSGKDYKGIYANSGTWINSKENSPHKVRTYLVIKPAEWTGSDLDVVSLYQYNKNSENQGPAYKPEFITEENIDIKK